MLSRVSSSLNNFAKFRISSLETLAPVLTYSQTNISYQLPKKKVNISNKYVFIDIDQMANPNTIPC